MTIADKLILTTSRKTLAGYDAFLDWATTQPFTTITYNQFANTVPYNPSSRVRLTLATIPADKLGCGTSWGAFGYNREIIGAVMHAFPTQALKDEALTSKRIVVFSHTLKGSGFMNAYTRNGYNTQSSNGGMFGMDEFIYWDPNQSKAMRVIPYTTSTPVEFKF